MKIWLIASALSITAIACGGESRAPRALPPELAVQAVAATRAKLPSAEAFVGNIRSQQAIIVATKMMGRIQSISVREGQAVKKGQLLVQVDAAEAHGAYEQSRAGLVAADVQFANAKRDFERLKSLFDKGAINEQQLEQMQGGLAAATAQRAQADANLRMTQTLLSYGRITAPEDGVVTRKWMDTGNLAGPGAPILSLENPKLLEISVSVPEDKAQKLAVGQAATIRIDSIAKLITSQIGAVVPTSDPMTRTSQIKISLPLESDLQPGQFATVRFDSMAHDDLTVPVDSLLRQGQLDGVFVVDQGVARLRWIQVGQSEDKVAQVLSGLHEGDLVISPLPADIEDGYRVQVRP
jgi:RND family efflux transporter MFP subunit